MAIATGSSVSHAEDDADVANIHYQAARKYYDIGKFDEALKHFQSAYLAKADPSLLYDVAQCHRQLGHANDAIAAYKRYLAARPDAANRAEVEKLIADLQRQGGAASAPPSATGPPEWKPNAILPTITTAAPPAGESVARVNSPTPEPPLYQRPWVWAAVGAVVVGGIVTAVALSGTDRQAAIDGSFPPGVVTVK